MTCTESFFLIFGKKKKNYTTFIKKDISRNTIIEWEDSQIRYLPKQIFSREVLIAHYTGP